MEGHELAVLKGGLETLKRHLPTLLIEANERHRPDAVQTLARHLMELGYLGFFIEDGALVPIEQFEIKRHWEAKGIENFIFLPASDLHKKQQLALHFNR